MKTNKAALKKEIKAAKLALKTAEASHGFDSEQRKAAVLAYWELQKQLGAIELAEVGINI